MAYLWHLDAQTVPRAFNDGRRSLLDGIEICDSTNCEAIERRPFAGQQACSMAPLDVSTSNWLPACCNDSAVGMPTTKSFCVTKSCIEMPDSLQ